MFAWAAESILGDQILAMALRATKKASVAELWRLNIEKERYCEIFYKEVCPLHPFRNIRVVDTPNFLTGMGETSIRFYNLPCHCDAGLPSWV